MGYKAAVQILQQAEELKAKVLRKSDLLNDAQLWTDQQALQTIYHRTLVTDLEYALDRKVELDLWNIGFKNHLNLLQEQCREKKNTRRGDYQALLTWCLESASGFYLTLLHELCNALDIDLPFRRRGTVYGQITTTSDLNLPQTSSCLYICQYCLVHLGDIARYRNERKQAENFYKQAIVVSPTSGHPYNQLALLETSRGDKLSTVFYYIRGISVKNPFPASSTNLLNTLSLAIDKDSPLDGTFYNSKMTAGQFVQLFLCTHGLLHTATDLPKARVYVQNLNNTMTALVATQNFSSEQLIKMTAINLYALKHVMATCSSSAELTFDERIVRELVLELLAGSLSAFLVPVHTLKADETILDYYALPAVKLLTYWIRSEPNVLDEGVFSKRLQIWPSLCKFLNVVQPFLKDFSDDYKSLPLSEDKMLQGFRPLGKSFKDLNFEGENETSKKSLVDENTQKLVRGQTIVSFGNFIADLEVNNTKLMTKTITNDSITFEPASTQPDPTNDLLEEMKSFNIADFGNSAAGQTVVESSEKRVGILKPQGSLEKSREEREQFSSSSSSSTSNANRSEVSASCNAAAKKDFAKQAKPRSKQNVAMQSIFKKLEENKQVKFNVEEMSPPPPLDAYNFNANKQQPSFINPQNSMMRNQFSAPYRPPQNPQNTMRNIPPNFMSFPPNMEVPPPNLQPPPQMLPYQTYNNSYNPTNSSRMPPYNMPPSQTPNSYPSQYPNNNKNEPPPNNSPWWPPPPNFNNPEPSKYPLQYNNSPQYPPSFGSGHKMSANQAGGDMFGGWTNFARGGYDMMSQQNFEGGSMRQAMLKEVGSVNHSMGSLVHQNQQQQQQDFMQQQQNPPGYSLFNANSWTPNLAGQLRGAKPQDGGQQQHSLFTGQGPLSLAQLLEQQQSQKND